jgi:hypothetical protein
LGIGDWGLGPIPNPQSPIPNPQSPIPKKFLITLKKIFVITNIINYFFVKKIITKKHEKNKKSIVLKYKPEKSQN